MLAYNKYIKDYIKPYEYPLEEIRNRKSEEEKIYVGTWNLDYTLALTLISYFKCFKKNNFGYPADMTAEEWDAVLDEIINGLDFYLKYAKGEDNPKCLKAYKTIKRTFNLIGKHFPKFWW